MRIEQLKYFLAVAQCGSVNGATQHVFVSQQGISDALKRMENELEIVLFIRSKTGLKLSKAGKGLIPHVQAVVEQYNKLEDHVFQLQHSTESHPANNSLKICANTMSTTFMIPDLIEVARQCQPALALECRDSSIEQMLRLTQSGEVDVSIFLLLQNDIDWFFNTLSKALLVYKLFDDEMVACLAASSPLASKKHLTSSEFWALPKCSYNGAYLPDSTIDNSLFFSNNTEFHLKLILQNNAVSTTISHFFSRTFPSDLVKALPIKPSINISYYVMFAKSRAYSPGLLAFLKLLADYLKELVSQDVAYHDFLDKQNK